MKKKLSFYGKTFLMLFLMCLVTSSAFAIRKKFTIEQVGSLTQIEAKTVTNSGLKFKACYSPLNHATLDDTKVHIYYYAPGSTDPEEVVNVKAHKVNESDGSWAGVYELEFTQNNFFVGKNANTYGLNNSNSLDGTVGVYFDDDAWTEGSNTNYDLAEASVNLSVVDPLVFTWTKKDFQVWENSTDGYTLQFTAVGQKSGVSYKASLVTGANAKNPHIKGTSITSSRANNVDGDLNFDTTNGLVSPTEDTPYYSIKIGNVSSQTQDKGTAYALTLDANAFKIIYGTATKYSSALNGTVDVWASPAIALVAASSNFAKDKRFFTLQVKGTLTNNKNTYESSAYLPKYVGSSTASPATAIVVKDKNGNDVTESFILSTTQANPSVITLTLKSDEQKFEKDEVFQVTIPACAYTANGQKNASALTFTATARAAKFNDPTVVIPVKDTDTSLKVKISAKYDYTTAAETDTAIVTKGTNCKAIITDSKGNTNTYANTTLSNGLLTIDLGTALAADDYTIYFPQGAFKACGDESDRLPASGGSAFAVKKSIVYPTEATSMSQIDDMTQELTFKLNVTYNGKATAYGLNKSGYQAVTPSTSGLYIDDSGTKKLATESSWNASATYYAKSGETYTATTPKAQGYYEKVGDVYNKSTATAFATTDYFTLSGESKDIQIDDVNYKATVVNTNASGESLDPADYKVMVTLVKDATVFEFDQYLTPGYHKLTIPAGAIYVADAATDNKEINYYFEIVDHVNIVVTPTIKNLEKINFAVSTVYNESNEAVATALTNNVSTIRIGNYDYEVTKETDNTKMYIPITLDDDEDIKGTLHKNISLNNIQTFISGGNFNYTIAEGKLVSDKTSNKEITNVPLPNTTFNQPSTIQSVSYGYDINSYNVKVHDAAMTVLDKSQIDLQVQGEGGSYTSVPVSGIVASETVFGLNVTPSTLFDAVKTYQIVCKPGAIVAIDGSVNLTTVTVPFTTAALFVFNDSKTKTSDITSALTASPLDKMTFERNFATGAEYQSLYVPFAIKAKDVADYFDIIKLSAVTEDPDPADNTKTILSFHYTSLDNSAESTDATFANMPYIIKPKQYGDVKFNLAQVSLFTPAADTNTPNIESSTVSDTYQFFGVIEDGGKAGTESPIIYAISSSGKFTDVKTDQNVSTWRWYMTITEKGTKTSYAKVIIDGNEISGGEATAIMNVTANAINGANGAIYNVAGQRVSTPVKGQVYIINGKKVRF